LAYVGGSAAVFVARICLSARARAHPLVCAVRAEHARYAGGQAYTYKGVVCKYADRTMCSRARGDVRVGDKRRGWPIYAG